MRLSAVMLYTASDKTLTVRLEQRVINPTNQLKEDVWQVLAHALANNLFWIAITIIVAAIALRIALPSWRLGRDLMFGGVGVVLLAALLHGAAWTPLL